MSDNNTNTTVVPENTEGNISEQQEQVLEQGSTNPDPLDTIDTTLVSVPSVAELKDMAANGDIDFEYVEKLVLEGAITPEDFEDILGVEYTAPDEVSSELTGEPSLNLPGKTIAEASGSNMPPADAADQEVAEELKHYKPLLAVTSAEALEHVKEAMTSTVEYINQGNTSLASKGAIAIADYVCFNAGIVDNGNALITVNSGMYRQILDNLTAMLPTEETSDASFKTRVGNMIKRAILLMAGKISVGYFVLPGDRKSVRANDEAFAEYPTDLTDPDAKVVRSTCIMDGVLTPRIPVVHKGAVVSYEPNHDNKVLRLLTNLVTEAEYSALWDKDGELQYHPTTGEIIGFKTGRMVADEAKAAAIKADADAKADKEPARRQTRGTQAEPKNIDEARERIADLTKELAETRKDASAVLTANKDDITSMFNSLGAYIRDETQPIPDEARVSFWRDAHDMFRRRMVNAHKVPSEDEMRQLTRLYMDLEAMMTWDDQKGVWEWLNPDGTGVERTYTLNGERAA